MIVFQVQNLSKAFGENEVLRGVSLAVQERERVGLVGANGSGKTTLLRCLTGEIQPDAGEVMRAATLTLGCLEQLSDSRVGLTAWETIMESFAHLTEKRGMMQALEEQMGQADLDPGKNIEQYARITEEYERANGYACENTARRILIGLGFSAQEFSHPLETFSGGQKTRLNLGRLLALAPDILLLDEPTNHLDMDAVEWLEDYVKNYSGTVLVVSHDRMFLDRVATSIAELSQGNLKTYGGNYSAYLQKKAADEAAEQRAYQKQQAYIQQTEDYIRRFQAGIKSKQARGRQSQLERVVRLAAPEQEKRIRHRSMKMKRESGNDVLIMEGVDKSYPGRPVLHDISLRVKKGDKIAVIGPNGSGKTTLLEIICGCQSPDRGTIQWGSRVDMAYFSQEHADLNPANTLLQEIIANFDVTLEEARTLLGGMLFSEEEVFKRVQDLSGGERGRLAFLKVILSGANFLLLDEPTNHLDIASCQVVEQLLADFAGTILVVSHDRHFIDQVADGILALEDGRAQYYWGNYSYYHEKKQQSIKNREMAPDEASEALKPDMRRREEQKAQERIRRRLDRDLAEVESQILAMEDRKKELERWLSEPSHYEDAEQASQYAHEYNQQEEQLLEAYERWARLSGGKDY